MNHFIVTLLAVLALGGSCTAVQVAVQSPAPGTTVGTPVQFKATATSAYPITGFVVYANNWNIYQVNSSSLNGSVALGPGTYTIYIRAWDSTGAYGTSPAFWITVTSSGVQVWVQSPAAGTTSSPVKFAATASSAYPITGFVVYANNQSVYQAYGSSLNGSAALGPGTYSVYVRAWDSSGAYGTSSAFSITVGSPNGLPAAPSTAKVIYNIEDTTDNWTSCSPCAGGWSSTNNFWSAPFQTYPSIDGASRQFYNGGGPWANVLWIKQLGNPGAYTNFLWDQWVYFDSTTAATVWSAEYDIFQAVNRQNFLMGSECVFGENHWSVWDTYYATWRNLGVPCPRFAPNTWHHIQWYTQRISANQYKFVTLAVDGVPHAINWTFYSQYRADYTTDGVGVQWQLDTGNNYNGAHEWVDQATLYLW